MSLTTEEINTIVDAVRTSTPATQNAPVNLHFNAPAPIARERKLTFNVGAKRYEMDYTLAEATARFLQLAGLKESRGVVEQEARKYAERGVTFGRSLETLTDTSGGIFLPSAVSDFVFDIAEQYGFVAGNALNLPIASGTQKVPNVATGLTFYATGEGQNIRSSQVAFKGIDLKPLLWGTIVPWTLQLDAEAGAKIVPIVVRKLGEALAKAQDNSFINGDGTSAFNGITGIGLRADAASVGVATATGGNNTFAKLSPEDWLKPIYKLAPSVRANAVYVMHHDREEQLLTLKDGDGRLIYGGPSDVRPVATLWGRRVFFTEAGFNTDGASKYATIVCDPSYLAFGTMDGLTVERLTEATILDVDNSTPINLAAQYSAALRAVARFDIGFGDNRAFAVLKTA